MKATIYARVSTEDQEREGTSLQSQIESCLSKAHDLGYQVSEEHTFSETWSGADLDRPQLSKARNLIRQREIKALICYSTDRLARNPIHIAIVAEECQKRGIEVIFVTEPLDNSPEGQLISYVRGYAAQIEREKIKERTMRGRKARAEKGMLPTGGVNLYGYIYNKETGHREINDYEASVVRTMFNWLVEDRVSRGELCRRLMDQGIPAPKGGTRWGVSTVGRILRNPVYCGETYANKMVCVEPEGKDTEGKRYKKIRRELRPREDWIPLNDATPAIISKELFEQAQCQLRLNMELAPRNQKYEWLLRGFVRCRWCGRRYHGNPEHGYRFYRCSGRSRLVSPNPCRNHQIPADWLEDRVWQEVKATLLQPELILAELQRKQALKTEANHLEQELELNRKRLEALDEAELRKLRIYLYGGDSSVEKYLAESRRMEAQEQRLKDQIAKLEKRIEEARRAEIDEANIERFFEIARQNLGDFSFDDKRLAFEALQLKVWVDGDKITIEGLIPMPDSELLTQHR